LAALSADHFHASPDGSPGATSEARTTSGSACKRLRTSPPARADPSRGPLGGPQSPTARHTRALAP
jgi:hypothetical protein